MFTSPSTLDDFWEASSVSGPTAASFGAVIAGFDRQAEPVHPFSGPGREIPLRPPRDGLQRLFTRRRSERRFGTAPLRHRDVVRLLASIGPAGDGRRIVPEAGALDAVHGFAICRRVTGPLAGRIVRYDHRMHSVADVAAVPDDDTLRAAFLIDPDEPLPQLVVVFIVDLAAVVAKYGARGGRFALVQVGHAQQNVGLRLARDRRRGYVLGGGCDREVLGLLGLGHTRARYGGAVACGR